MLTDTQAARSRTLARLPLRDFIARWRWIVGEPPAAMLESRSEMISLLVQSAPIAPGVPAVVDGTSRRSPPPGLRAPRAGPADAAAALAGCDMTSIRERPLAGPTAGR